MVERKKTDRRRRRRPAPVRDRHLLYTAAVQSVDCDVEFFERVYRGEHGGRFLKLREDFCGTAVLACEWVRQHPDHRAWGVDMDRATLEYSRTHYVPRLGSGAERLRLLRRNVLDVSAPKVDVVTALNFSYCVFKQRVELGRYFRVVRRSLRPGGLFFLDCFGGTEALAECKEARRIPVEKGFDGTRIPAFTYVWDQATFNPIDHHLVCHIHFKLNDGTRIRRAFTYDWRLWTLPELRELLLEAGFARTEVYVEGWDGDEANGIFRRRTRFVNEAGWIAYVVGFS